MDENIEHVQGIAVFVTHLFGIFSINGGGERIGFFRKKEVEKYSEGFLELFEINAGKISRKGGAHGWLGPFEAERNTEGGPMSFRPALNLGDFGNVCEQSQENENHHSLKVVTNASRIAWVLDFSEGVGKGGQEPSLGVGRGIHGKTSVFYVL